MTLHYPTPARAGTPGRAAGLGYLLFLALLLLAGRAARAQAPPPAWQVALAGNNGQPGTAGTSQARATAVNAAGDVFVTGSFTGTVVFGTTTLVSAGNNDVFVAKWDATARTFAWATSGGGTGNDFGQGIAVSGTNVYVTGFFTSGTSASFAGQTLAGAGSQDVFVAKYVDGGSSGVRNGWATSGGGTGSDVGYGIAVSGSNVYVTGYFVSSTSASIAGRTLAGAGSQDVFVAKYVDGGGTGFSNGWATSGGGTGSDYGNGIAVSGANVYVTGYFASNTGASFAGQTLAGAGNLDVFVAKYVDRGSSVSNGWATSGGGTSNDYGYGLAVSGTSVYVTGFFTSNTGASIAGQTLAGAGDLDVFVAKYVDGGSSGVSNGWVTSGGGTGGDVGYGIAVSGSNVYVTGYFVSSTSASIAGQPLASTGTNNNEMFVAKYVDGGSSGVSNGWATSGGGTSNDYGNGIAVSGANVYVAGQVGSAVARFGPAANPLRAPASSALLGALDPSTGTWQQANGPLQGIGTSQVRATAVNAAGDAFVTGSFSGTVGFGPTRLVSAGNNDVFVAKWDATARTFTWATSGGGTGDDYGYGLAVSGSNVYVTGYFACNTGASFAGRTLAGTGTGNIDVFVAKYVDGGSSGVSSGWVTSGGGTGGDAGYSIAVSGTNVYVTGIFASNTGASFAGQPLTGAGFSDVFVAKYVDAGGIVSSGWATSGGGTDIDYGNGIAVDGANVYVTGTFVSSTSASFAGQPLAGAGFNDVFVAKYVDAGGSSFTNGWATSGGGTGDDFGQGIAVSGSNVYVTGAFSSNASASFAGQKLAGTGGGGSDVFVAKYIDGGSSGVSNGWATSGGSRSSDYGYGIAVSGANVYVTGIFASSTSASFAGQTLTGTSGSSDVFVAKYVDAGGTSFSNGWATSGGGPASDYGYSIAVSGQRVYAAGCVAPVATFGSSTVGTAGGAQSNFFAGLLDVPTPFLASLSPASGAAGSTLGVSGLNLDGATAITFTSGGGVATAAPAGYAVVNNGTGLTGVAVPAGLALGPYTLTVTTPNGTSNGLTYTVRCAVAALTQPVALTLDRNGTATLAASAVDNGSSSPCGAVTLSVAPSTFTCANLGPTTVTLTVTAPDGTTATASATVTVSTPALASTTWTGAASADASDCRNWSYGQLPTASISAVVPAGLSTYPLLPAGPYQVNSLSVASGASLGTDAATTLQVSGHLLLDGPATFAGPVQLVGPANQTLSGQAAPSFGELLVAKPAGTVVHLQRDLPIGTSLTLRGGVLATASYRVQLGATASLSETNASYVLGNVATTRPLTPAAAESFGGLGLTLTPAAGSVAPGLTPVVRTTGPALAGTNLSQSIQRYFDIQPATDQGLSVDMVFNYFEHELNGLAAADLRVFKSATTAGPWQNLGQAGRTADAATASGTVSVAGISRFSIWTLGTPARPLPVVLTSFTATAVAGAVVRLAWATASETNSKAFEVERSADGVAFAKIGTVAAAGTTAAAATYALRDAALPAGATALYYRLRQVDVDGTFSYSPVRAVALGAGGLALFPNPATTGATLTGATPGHLVQVLDALGRCVATATADAAGTARLALPTGLASGVYVVRAGPAAARLVVE